MGLPRVIAECSPLLSHLERTCRANPLLDIRRERVEYDQSYSHDLGAARLGILCQDLFEQFPMD
jgi:hypothetical protein